MLEVVIFFGLETEISSTQGVEEIENVGHFSPTSRGIDVFPISWRGTKLEIRTFFHRPIEENRFFQIFGNGQIGKLGSCLVYL